MDNPCPVVYEIPVGGSSRKAADTDPSLPFDAVDVYGTLAVTKSMILDLLVLDRTAQGYQRFV